MLKKSEAKRGALPLTPWELPKLIEPMHRWRPIRKGRATWRAHFLPILAFIYRNRFAVASQIQRRFADALPSDRTARRHLTELEALGCVGVADTRSTSPLFPKVYFVTGRGIRKIEESLRERGKPGRCGRRDRRRPEAYSADHVLHEILTTEFLLNVWQTVQRRRDLQLLTVQRRALERQAGFAVEGGHGRLKPDAMFLYRQNGGLMCCFLELDNGTMNPQQLRSKFLRYEVWGRSAIGQEYLMNLYRTHGVDRPRPVFRLLVVAHSRRPAQDWKRLVAVRKAAEKSFSNSRSRLWLTTVAELLLAGGSLEYPIWRRGGGATYAAEQTSENHCLFPAPETAISR